MKKTVFLLILCLASFSMQAQERFSYSAELVAGVGFGKGPLFSVTPEFVAQYELGGGFKAGVGAGIRYARPCTEFVTENGKDVRREFGTELDVPVFLRLGFGAGWFFAQVDGGYSLGALTLQSKLDKKIVLGAGGYSGLFVEPQLGCRIGEHSALALGFLLHQSALENREKAQDAASLSATVYGQRAFTPALTLRYAFIF